MNNPNQNPQPTQGTEHGQSKPGQQQQNAPGKTGQQGDEKKS